MSELIRAMDVSYRCLSLELNKVPRSLGDMTGELENIRNRHSYPSFESKAPFIFTPTDLLPMIYLHPVVQGERYPITPARTSCVPPVELRQTMGELRNLSHALAPEDTGHPTFYYGLSAFPYYRFARFSYHHEGGGYT
jgi:hypothetical protein